MSYPQRSNFWSGDAASAWWQHRDGGRLYLCSSQGRTVMRQLQRELRNRLPLFFSAMGVGSSTSDIPDDGNFDGPTFTGLMAALADLDVPFSVRATIEQDYTANIASGGVRDASRGVPLSRATTLAVVWIAFDATLPYSAVLLPDDLVTLRIGAAPPSDGDYADTWTCVPTSAASVPGSTDDQPDISIVGNPPSDDDASSTSSGGFPWLLALGIAGAYYLSKRKGKFL